MVCDNPQNTMYHVPGRIRYEEGGINGIGNEQCPLCSSGITRRIISRNRQISYPENSDPQLDPNPTNMHVVRNVSRTTRNNTFLTDEFDRNECHVSGHQSFTRFLGYIHAGG